MTERRKAITILMADDDADDRLLAQEALAEHRVVNELRFVEDGEALMRYLRQEGEYGEPGSAPRPGIILLDLNMPKKDGREALREIKGDPRLRSIPVIVLTTSRQDEDVLRSYELGANSFVAKPVTFDRLVEVMRLLGTYWIEFVELPVEAGETAKGLKPVTNGRITA